MPDGLECKVRKPRTFFPPMITSWMGKGKPSTKTVGAVKKLEDQISEIKSFATEILFFFVMDRLEVCPTPRFTSLTNPPVLSLRCNREVTIYSEMFNLNFERKVCCSYSATGF